MRTFWALYWTHYPICKHFAALHAKLMSNNWANSQPDWKNCDAALVIMMSLKCCNNFWHFLQAIAQIWLNWIFVPTVKAYTGNWQSSNGANWIEKEGLLLSEKYSTRDKSQTRNFEKRDWNFRLVFERFERLNIFGIHPDMYRAQVFFGPPGGPTISAWPGPYFSGRFFIFLPPINRLVFLIG